MVLNHLTLRNLYLRFTRRFVVGLNFIYLWNGFQATSSIAFYSFLKWKNVNAFKTCIVSFNLSWMLSLRLRKVISRLNLTLMHTSRINHQSAQTSFYCNMFIMVKQSKSFMITHLMSSTTVRFLVMYMFLIRVPYHKY